MPKDARIGIGERAALIHAAKHFLWSMRVDPPAGRKRSSLASLHMKGLILRTLIGWMAIEGLRRFSDIDPSAVDRLCVWLRGRPARNGKARVSPSTVSNYLLAIKDLYRQRTKLSDAPRVDPLPLDTTFEAAGVTRASRSSRMRSPSRSLAKRCAGWRSMARRSSRLKRSAYEPGPSASLPASPAKPPTMCAGRCGKRI
jgi:hypothetical protein